MGLIELWGKTDIVRSPSTKKNAFACVAKIAKLVDLFFLEKKIHRLKICLLGVITLSCECTIFFNGHLAVYPTINLILLILLRLLKVKLKGQLFASQTLWRSNLLVFSSNHSFLALGCEDNHITVMLHFYPNLSPAFGYV